MDGERSASQLELLSEYTRAASGGGLLWTIQGLLLAIQTLVLPSVVTGQWWSPVWLLPIYGLYFLVRNPVWRRLYGSRGQVESEKLLQEAKKSSWRLLIYLLPALYLVWPNALTARTSTPGTPMGISVYGGMAWSAGLWAILVLGGRLPLDFLYFLTTQLLSINLWREQPAARLWVAGDVSGYRLLAVALILVGLYQHWRFHHRLKEGNSGGR